MLSNLGLVMKTLAWKIFLTELVSWSSALDGAVVVISSVVCVLPRATHV